MQAEGLVSLCLGHANSRVAVDAALVAEFSPDGDLLGSPFSRGFAVGDYEDATREAVFFETASKSLPAILAGSGYADVTVPKFEALPVVHADHLERLRARSFPAPLLDFPSGAKLKDARQRNELTRSERGARLVSAAIMANSCSAPAPRRTLRLVLDRPFLLAMRRTGATRPYVLAWFGNDDPFVEQP